MRFPRGAAGSESALYAATGGGVVPSCTDKVAHERSSVQVKDAVSVKLHIGGPAVMTGRATGTYTRVVVLSFVRAVTVTVCPHAMMPSVFFQLHFGSPAVMTGCTTGTYTRVVVPYCTDEVTHERDSVQNGGATPNSHTGYPANISGHATCTTLRYAAASSGVVPSCTDEVAHKHGSVKFGHLPSICQLLWSSGQRILATSY